MKGAGFQPAGTSPAGFGAPTKTGAKSDLVLPDSTGLESLGSRMIDPLAKDYVAGEDGQIKGMDNLQHMVQLAIAKAQPELMELDRLDGGFDKAVASILTRAVAHLVARRLIEVVGVSTRKNREGGLQPGQAVTVFKWRDRTTNEEREEAV